MGMPVIVAANTKGGCGKSTASLVLSTTLAGRGATVRLIDADIKQGTSSKFGKAGVSKYSNTVVPMSSEEDLTDMIDRLASEFQFVIVDVQGSANLEIASAMSRADLVIIPMNGKTADSEAAPEAIAMLKKQEKMFRRKIPFGILFVNTKTPIVTREEKEIREQIEGAGLPVFKTDLRERTGFSHINRFKLALDEQNDKDTSGLEAAIKNAQTFTNEVLALLREHQQEKKQAEVEVA
jgi:chromosome partitioning protein